MMKFRTRLVWGWVPLCCLFVCLFGPSRGQTDQDAKDLKTYLFNTSGYDNTIRPLYNQATSVDVYVELSLFGINSVDEVAETLKTTATLVLYWTDDLLTWTPSDFGNIDFYFFAQKRVWKPDLALKNSALTYKQLGDDSLYAAVFSDGTVRWQPFQVFESTCSIDMTNFPYDTQACKLEFAAWSYTKFEVYMYGGNNGINLDEYTENSAWRLVETSWYAQLKAVESSIVFVIKLQRKPQYSLLTLVFPVIMLAILNIFVFCLPCESGEKASYAVTVFLAFAVYLTIMQASFPQNSDTVSYFAIYVIISTTQSTLITLIAMAMLRLTSLDDDTPIPKCLVALARFTNCKSTCTRIGKFRAKMVSSAEIIKTPEGSEGCGKAEADPTLPDDVISESESNVTWKEVINSIDAVCVILFSVAFFIETMVCLLLAKND